MKSPPIRGFDQDYVLDVRPLDAIAGCEHSLNINNSTECSKCRRSGRDIFGRACRACGGLHWIPFVRARIRVKIPANTWNGAKLRVRGMGLESPNGGECGDLIVEIRITPIPQQSTAKSKTLAGSPGVSALKGGTR